MKSEFSNGQLGIRPFRPDDVQLLFAAVRESLTELTAWMPWCHPSYSLDDSATFVGGRAAEWERDEHYSFVIHDLKDGAFLGTVGVNFINRARNFANLGYWVRTSRTRRGVGSAAARLAARFGFEELGFHRLEIVAIVGNLASQRVAEKAGALREGILRNRLVLHGQPHDAVMYSLVAADLRA